MEIAHIVAHSNNNVIGNENDIPWKSKIDLTFFKKTTIGKVCIVGRKTYETIKHLKDRHFIVLTRTKLENVDYCDNIEDAIAMARLLTNDMIYIIGGSQIYNNTFKYADYLFVTQININVDGDSFYNVPDNFDLDYHSLPILDNDFTIEFKTYKKRA